MIAAVALVLAAAGLVSCTVPVRGELGISVDAQGRVIGLIAVCSNEHVEYLHLVDITQRGVQVTLRPTSDDRPKSIVLSDPGGGWSDDWPERPTYGEDPRKLTANHHYALDGQTSGDGLFDGDARLFGIDFVPEQVLGSSQLRSGVVLTWDEQIVSADEFYRRDPC